MNTLLHSYFNRGLIATCLFICTIFSTNIMADTPRTLSIQGYVTEIGQTVGLNGEHSVRFTLYDTSGRSTNYMDAGGEYVDPTGSGATVVWTSVLNVSFDDGKYSVSLGVETPFPADAFRNDSEVLAIQINDDDELSPRMSFNAVPYSMRSSVSSNVDGDISPRSVSIADESGNTMLVIDEDGHWLGHTAGLEGAVGAQGPQGEPGVQGPKGDKGDTGAAGADGPKGEKGDMGATGAIGPQGIQGLKGDIGATGAPGPKGEQGEPGPKGDKGDTGVVGATGAPGPQGEQGPKGDTGIQGPSGIRGATGVVGSSILTTKQCTATTTCACEPNTLLIAGGASCTKNQYLYKSQPVLNSKTTWEAVCEVFSNGADANPATINLICASDNDA